jgi:hypothetical protein
MGQLHYGDSVHQLDDRVLAHLQLVISTKLRRHEKFFAGWVKPVEAGGGRESFWVDNGVPIHFVYTLPVMPRLNPLWLEEMLLSAGTAEGLIIGAEPDAPRRDPASRDGVPTRSTARV